jgi:hypothetical protein
MFRVNTTGSAKLLDGVLKSRALRRAGASAGGARDAAKSLHVARADVPFFLQSLTISRSPRVKLSVHDNCMRKARTTTMFSEQERQAFDLGRRMAAADFNLQDNPFAHIHPRFAVQWTHGFFAANALHGLSAAMSRGELSTPRRHPRLVSAA